MTPKKKIFKITNSKFLCKDNNKLNNHNIKINKQKKIDTFLNKIRGLSTAQNVGRKVIKKKIANQINLKIVLYACKIIKKINVNIKFVFYVDRWAIKNKIAKT